MTPEVGLRATQPPPSLDERLRLLVEAGEILASSLDYEDTLRSVARLVVPSLADWCAIELLSDGKLRTVEVAHVDPAKVALARELEERYPANPDDPRGAYEVVRSGKSELYADIPDDLLREGARDENHLHIMRELGLSSAMVVPLTARGRVLGALTLVSAESQHRFDAHDLLFAETLAARAAIAVDNARLFAATRAAEARYRLLFDSNPHPMWVYDPDTLAFLAVNDATVREYGYTREEFLAMTVPELYPVDQAPEFLTYLTRHRRALESPRVWRHRRKNGSTLVVEATSHELQLDGRKARLVLASDVTERQRRQEALRLLAEAGTILASSLDYHETLRSVARLAVPTLADWCAIHLLKDGVLERVETAHADSQRIALALQVEVQYPPDPKQPAGLYAVVRNGKSEIYPNIADELLQVSARDAEHLRMLRELAFRSIMLVPLQARGRVLGVMTFISADSGRRYGPGDLATAEALVNRAALAVDNARLFSEARAAEAEGARLRAELERNAQELEQRVVQRTAELDAFAYSVSHDLRAPLRSIDGFSHALLEDYGGRLDAEGQEDLRRVRAATRRMSTLIDDLLQLSRLTRADMQRETVDMSALAASVAADLQAGEPERTVELAVQPGLEALGDSRLLRLALENLLGNAWKYTGKQSRARLEFGMTERAHEQVFYVSDDGVGFDMAYVDKLFNPFQRLHTEGEFPGTGVGLATVQRIVRRHGGRIWAQAEVGAGATFYFTLAPSDRLIPET